LVWFGSLRELARTEREETYGFGAEILGVPFADGLAALVGVGGWRTLEEAAGDDGGFMQARLPAQRRSSSGRLVQGEPCSCRWGPARRCLRWLVHVDLARSGGRRRSLNLDGVWLRPPESGWSVECCRAPVLHECTMLDLNK